MKIPYDNLITDKEPFILIERAHVSVSGSSVVAKTKNGIKNIPVASVQCLMLGNGVSITSEAAIICAKHNCYISFLKGGSNVHSVWHAGRYSAPEPLIKQIKIYSDPILRLEVGKRLIKKRCHLMGDLSYLLDLERLDKCFSVEELLGLEGSLARKTYALLSQGKFKRDQNSMKGVNGVITLANNALYSFSTSVLLNMGLSPSIGIIHGQTRRGGMSFDLADVFKYPLITKPAFDGRLAGDPSSILRGLSKSLSANRRLIVKDIIKTVEDILWS